MQMLILFFNLHTKGVASSDLDSGLELSQLSDLVIDGHIKF